MIKLDEAVPVGDLIHIGDKQLHPHKEGSIIHVNAVLFNHSKLSQRQLQEQLVKISSYLAGNFCPQPNTMIFYKTKRFLCIFATISNF